MVNVFESLRRWKARPRGVEETEPPRPEITPEEEATRAVEQEDPPRTQAEIRAEKAHEAIQKIHDRDDTDD